MTGTQTDRQTDKRTHTDKQINRDRLTDKMTRQDKQNDRLIDRQIDMQTDSQTDRQTDKQTNKQTNKQSDREALGFLVQNIKAKFGIDKLCTLAAALREGSRHNSLAKSVLTALRTSSGLLRYFSSKYKAAAVIGGTS